MIELWIYTAMVSWLAIGSFYLNSNLHPKNENTPGSMLAYLVQCHLWPIVWLCDRTGTWWMVTYGRSGSPYLTKVKLSSMSDQGQLILHIFHRGDDDPDPHDHPCDFWTFPLRTYMEEFYHAHIQPDSCGMPNGRTSIETVSAWRVSFRPAWYTHKVLDAPKHWFWGRKIVTLVWQRPDYRPWGFWRKTGDGWCWVEHSAYMAKV